VAAGAQVLQFFAVKTYTKANNSATTDDKVKIKTV
jgi:hypothetical protein